MEQPAWVPYNFQLANWAIEPATGLPVESESTEKYGNWVQTCVPYYSVGGGQQLVEYYAAPAAAPTQHYSVEKEAQDPVEVVVSEDGLLEFQADIDKAKEKMHRYPESIRDLGDWYTVPRTVAIGPYHRNSSRTQLKKAEQVKRVAAYHCVDASGGTEKELYDAVVPAADDAYARRLYDEDVMEGLGCDDFRRMMFLDACFLVQYMFWHEREEVAPDPWLDPYFFTNRNGIHHDVWLLENQLPWKVVEAVMDRMKLRLVNLKKFVAGWRDRLHDRQDLEPKCFVWDSRYKPPHLLALLRHYIVGRRTGTQRDKHVDVRGFKSVSFSVSAVELAKIGITLAANETSELADMALSDGILGAKLSLAPLSLNYARASRLVNMAALEICCLTPNTLRYNVKDSAVCSYLLVLSMLVHREADVHELRRQGILQGGAGLNDKQVLDFLTCFQSLPDGKCSTDTMVDIENYKLKNKVLTKGNTFWYKNKKYIMGALPIIGAVVSIVKLAHYL